MYPVGSIYLASNNISPAATIGGSWTRISGACLYAADDTVSIGNYGGSKVINLAQMPSHAHPIYLASTDADTGFTIDSWAMYIGNRWATEGALRANGPSPIYNATSSQTWLAGSPGTVGEGADYTPYSYGINVWVRIA